MSCSICLPGQHCLSQQNLPETSSKLPIFRTFIRNCVNSRSKLHAGVQLSPLRAYIWRGFFYIAKCQPEACSGRAGTGGTAHAKQTVLLAEITGTFLSGQGSEKTAANAQRGYLRDDLSENAVAKPFQQRRVVLRRTGAGFSHGTGTDTGRGRRTGQGHAGVSDACAPAGTEVGNGLLSSGGRCGDGFGKCFCGTHAKSTAETGRCQAAGTGSGTGRSL